MMRVIFFLVMIFSLHAEAIKPRICLNMIVKNESHVIERALRSVKDIIDYWVIVDTGSYDETERVIFEVLKDIPGELHHRGWRNFGENRTEALNLAKEKADYLLFLDADDWIEYEEGFSMPLLTKDLYRAVWESHQFRGFRYIKPFIVKSSLPWFWEGAIHEYLYSDGVRDQEVLTGMKYVFSGEGSRSNNPRKFIEAAEFLEHSLITDPQNSRTVFYLAESYRDAKILDKALFYFQERIGMGGWEEEIFWSFLQIAHLKRELGFSLDEVIESYIAAHKLRPERGEPIYYLADLYNRNSHHDLAYQCIKNWQALSKKHREDTLFRSHWIDEYGVLFQLSIASFYVGKYWECLMLNDQLLLLDNLAKEFREQIIINRQYPVKYLQLDR